MQQTEIEKRKTPRLDTSGSNDWIVRIHRDRGKPVEGTIINLSLGGLAFVGQWGKVERMLKRHTTKTEIVLPNGRVIHADSTLLRVWPKQQIDEYVCVMIFSELDPNCIRQLEKIILN